MMQVENDLIIISFTHSQAGETVLKKIAKIGRLACSVK